MLKFKCLFLLMFLYSLAFCQSNHCLNGFKGNANYKLLKSSQLGNAGKPFRVVKTQIGDEKITLIDVYQMQFVDSLKNIAVIVKIEFSDSANFNVDKEILFDQLNFLCSNNNKLMKDVFVNSIDSNPKYFGYYRKDFKTKFSQYGNYFLFANNYQTIHVAFIKNDKVNIDEDRWQMLKQKFMNDILLFLD